SNLSRGKQRLAIDLVLIPYHGKPYRHESEIYRSQPKSGTSHFHAYATRKFKVQSSKWKVEKATLNFALCTLHLHDAGSDSRQKSDEQHAGRWHAKVCVVEEKRF
ncbi:MAG: hypothetical protein FWH27_16170, partial [Planctomycetaceae bacterium]|nr:hypothetical protein [Planctomycetaceae bacterium]